jgi:hypothetical protein
MLSLKTIGVLGGSIFLFVAGWVVHGWKYDSAYKAAYQNTLTQISVQQEQNKKLTDQYAAKITQYQTEIGKMKENVQVEIEKPVYVDCVVPDSGVRLINNIVIATNNLKSAK